MTLSKAQFRAMRERCGISQQMLANQAGVKVMSVKRWEKPGEAMPPQDVQDWLEDMLAAHVRAVRTVLDVVDSIIDRQEHEPTHVSLSYYRSQAHYDRYGRDKANFSVVNARSREAAAILENRGVAVRYRYPGDDTPTT